MNFQQLFCTLLILLLPINVFSFDCQTCGTSSHNGLPELTPVRGDVSKIPINRNDKEEKAILEILAPQKQEGLLRLGQTLKAQPTLYFFFDPKKIKSGDFTLKLDIRKQNPPNPLEEVMPEILVEKKITLDDSSTKIHHLRLGEYLGTENNLQDNTVYKWSITLTCDDAQKEYSSYGLIKVTSDSNDEIIQNCIKDCLKSSKENVVTFCKKYAWYDALNSLLEQLNIATASPEKKKQIFNFLKGEVSNELQKSLKGYLKLP
ncbi:MAG: DUF928 domain-containing protein [Thiotrichaceae bacterium]|nr:DUF928 domain-containing protein [Thiotrichaceae bacterium]